MKTTFYDKPGLKGNSHKFDFGSFDRADFTVYLQDLLSVSIPKKARLTIYNSLGLNGRNHTINNTGNKTIKIPNLHLIFPFTIKSFKIECACQSFNDREVIYEKQSRTLCGDDSKLTGYTYYDVHPEIILNEPPRSNPAVIIIPDFANTKELYDCMQQQFAQNKISSLVLDIRGVGSSYSATSATYSDIIEDYRSLMNTLGLFDKRPILIGHGFGGAIAQLWAITYPVELEKLILLSSAPFPIYSTYNLANTDINNWVASSITLAQLATTLSGLTYTSDKECQIMELEKSINGIDEDTQKLFITQNADNVSLLTTFQNYYLDTLLIHGVSDQYIPFNGSDDLQVLMNNDNNVTYIKYDTGHAPQFERLTNVMSAIIQFINPDGLEYFN